VIKAILLDEEARSCEQTLAPDYGKLEEPIIRRMNLARSFALECMKDTALYVVAGDTLDQTPCQELRYWLNGFDSRNGLKQSPLGATSVFNFYLPDHQPVGEIAAQGLVAPEFKIHDSSTAINYMNLIFVGTVWDYYGGNWDGDVNEDLGYLSLDTEAYEEMFVEDQEAFYNYLDIVLLHGNMTDRLRGELRQFVDNQPNWVDDYRKVRGVIFLVMISPEYTILK